MAYSNKEFIKFDISKNQKVLDTSLTLSKKIYFDGILDNYDKTQPTGKTARAVIQVLFTYQFSKLESLTQTLRATDSKLDEFLKLSDLAKSSGMSDFTKTFYDERHQKTKEHHHTRSTNNEQRVSKLLKCELQSDGSAMFYWLSESTEKYDAKHVVQVTDPHDGFKLKPEPSKLYTIQLKVLNVVKWLKTFPEKKVLDKKDIKEILEVADMQVFSNDPSFHWQGMNFSVSQLDGSIYPTNIAPKNSKRNAKGKVIQIGWKDKHGDGQAFFSKAMAGIFKQLPFYANVMASMLTKELIKQGFIK